MQESDPQHAWRDLAFRRRDAILRSISPAPKRESSKEISAAAAASSSSSLSSSSSASSSSPSAAVPTSEEKGSRGNDKDIVEVAVDDKELLAEEESVPFAPRPSLENAQSRKRSRFLTSNINLFGTAVSLPFPT